MGLFSCIARFFGWRDGDTSVLRSWSQKTARKHFRSGNGTLDDVIEAFFATIVQLDRKSVVEGQIVVVGGGGKI